MHQIDSQKSRDTLAPRREPYWVWLEAGRQLGFRKLAAGEGTWIAKWRDDESGRRHYKALGKIRDEGKRTSYSIAKKQAEGWFAELEKGVKPHSLTVKAACERHIDALRSAGGDLKANAEKARFERLVYGDRLAKVPLSSLKKADLESWRQRVAALPAKVSRSKKKSSTRPRAPSTINRDMVPLRAALNRALDDGLVSSALPWSKALRPIKNADRRRDIYLTRAERTRLIEKAVDEVKPFLRALALLPLRPGALAALTVADFSAARRTLRIGTDKSGKERSITLPQSTVAMLKEQARGKLPGAALIARGDKSHWNKDAWKKPVKLAAIAAKLPVATSAYALRHSVITDLVTQGLDLLTVAQISGTSVAMIERHYGHLRHERAAQALASLTL